MTTAPTRHARAGAGTNAPGQDAVEGQYFVPMTTFANRRRMRTLAATMVALTIALALSACSSSSSSSSSQAATTTTTTTAAPGGAVTPTTLAGGKVATGSVTCTNVTGTIAFNPPLTNGGTSPETTSITLTASGCTPTGSSASTVTGGTATATIQSATNGCLSLLTSKPVAVAVAWSPSSIHASVATFSGYAIVTDASSHIGFGLPNSGGTASIAGSFAGADNGAASKATTYSGQTQTTLLAACATAAGVPSLAILNGSVTFG
jgi:hypothetical protein